MHKFSLNTISLFIGIVITAVSIAISWTSWPAMLCVGTTAIVEDYNTHEETVNIKHRARERTVYDYEVSYEKGDEIYYGQVSTEDKYDIGDTIEIQVNDLDHSKCYIFRANPVMSLCFCTAGIFLGLYFICSGFVTFNPVVTEVRS